ncbi:hypothetical protein CTI12_AA097750 [Artemisia annua]|uniref:chloroplast protein-transporting ATPase n=1 Tax=Artemisia annua TaxID=35608 RepID=A0A2U1PWQ9_ARTAN|nr:hypothetical protein CTI12_AA097750 [Artemisia annua]
MSARYCEHTHPRINTPVQQNLTTWVSGRTSVGDKYTSRSDDETRDWLLGYVNDYLAQRAAEWMGRVRHFLGLSVALIQELGFDYPRDNLAGSSGQLVMRWIFITPKPFHFAIVDEVDSVLIDEVDPALIDEGRNPLLISGEVNDTRDMNISMDCSVSLLTTFVI